MLNGWPMCFMMVIIMAHQAQKMNVYNINDGLREHMRVLRTVGRGVKWVLIHGLCRDVEGRFPEVTEWQTSPLPILTPLMLLQSQVDSIKDTTKSLSEKFEVHSSCVDPSAILSIHNRYS